MSLEISCENDNVSGDQFFHQVYSQHVMASCCQIGTSYHPGNTFDVSGYDQVDKRFPVSAQELF